jgi:hypothetical protein
MTVTTIDPKTSLVFIDLQELSADEHWILSAATAFLAKVADS